MKKSGLTSILITYFNEKELLIRCLHSINKQSLLPNEVIIYDDASDINVKEYIDKKKYDFSIQIVRGEENKGPGYGRNLLLAMAKGEFIRFHDADDELLENALLEIEKAIIKSKADIILNEVTSYDEKGKLISEKVIGLSQDIMDIFGFSLVHTLLIPSITYKKDIAISIEGFKLRSVLPQSEDADFNRRIFLKTNNFYFINKALVRQNIRSLGYSSKNHSLVWTSNLKSLLDLKQKISSHHFPSYAEALLKTGLQLYHQKNYHSAKIAFNAYKTSGYANYLNYNIVKRNLAKVFGPMFTEHLSMIYKNLLPANIREKLKNING